MTAKEFIKTELVKQGNAVFDSAARVPEDKLTWKPMEEGRSTLDLAQECAYCPLWCVDTLKTRKFEMSDVDDANADAAEKNKEWNTIEECRTAFHKNLEVLNEAIDGFPEEDMAQTMDLPWGNFSFAGLMSVATWNCIYHNGQINYIQTLYGDKSM